MKRDVLVASLLLASWCLVAGLAWRLVLRGYALPIENSSLRQAFGIVGLLAALLLAYVPVNGVHRRLGGSGSFLRWAVKVLNQAMRRTR